MGRNQLIALMVYGFTWAVSVGLVFGGKVDGKIWLDWSLLFAPVAVSTILVPSAAIKSVRALTSKEPEA